jgi:hypothetical protein
MRASIQRAALAVGIAGLAAISRGETVFASTLTGSLIRFDSATPGVIQSAFGIQGLAANESVRGIDFRPATGALFALGSFGNLYSLNTGNGQATLVAPLSVALNANSNGLDFNPTVDRLRIIAETNQNLRVVPDTGATTVDGTLAFGAGDPNFGVDPNGVHAAYTNSFAGATSTTLYGRPGRREPDRDGRVRHLGGERRRLRRGAGREPGPDHVLDDQPGHGRGHNGERCGRRLDPDGHRRGPDTGAAGAAGRGRPGRSRAPPPPLNAMRTPTQTGRPSARFTASLA